MILIVEDEQILASLLEVTFASNGISNASASNAKGALEIMRGSKSFVDLAVIDLGLPDMDGLTLCRRLREFNPQLKILITSGSYNLDVRKMVLEQGVDSIIWKPYDLDEILGRVEELLSREDIDLRCLSGIYPN
ncbi:MAG: response regulator [Ignavibacteria bacterium]|nr:response regulator [Ignavibacteria bacterium]